MNLQVTQTRLLPFGVLRDVSERVDVIRRCIEVRKSQMLALDWDITLSKQAMPMIRYRTRDITAIHPEPCGCGRTIRRIRRIGRRSDDMFIIRGVNVFPSQVETALLKVEGTLPHYQIILTRETGLDAMEVQVEVTPEFFSDKIRALESLQHKLADAVEHVLGIRVKVTLVEPRTLARSEGKAKRVTDKRQI